MFIWDAAWFVESRVWYVTFDLRYVQFCLAFHVKCICRQLVYGCISTALSSKDFTQSKQMHPAVATSGDYLDPSGQRYDGDSTIEWLGQVSGGRSWIQVFDKRVIFACINVYHISCIIHRMHHHLHSLLLVSDIVCHECPRIHGSLMVRQVTRLPRQEMVGHRHHDSRNLPGR